MDYEQHIRALANELGATIRTQPTGSPGADTETGTLWLSPPDGTVHWYLSSLHELGHLADRPAPKSLIEAFGSTPRIVESESRAWEWALAHSQLPFEDARADVALTLGSYLADMFTAWGTEALQELHGGATERLVRRIGTDVDLTDSARWVLALGMSPNLPEIGKRSWQYTVDHLAT